MRYALCSLQDVELLGNNHKAQLDEGGALLAEDVGQLRLQRVRCAGNFVLLAGGCIKTLRVRELTLADSRFTGNVVRTARRSSVAAHASSSSVPAVAQTRMPCLCCPTAP